MMNLMMAKATSKVKVIVINARIAISIGRLESGSSVSVGSTNFIFEVKLELNLPGWSGSTHSKPLGVFVGLQTRSPHIPERMNCL